MSAHFSKEAITAFHALSQPPTEHAAMSSEDASVWLDASEDDDYLSGEETSSSTTSTRTIGPLFPESHVCTERPCKLSAGYLSSERKKLEVLLKNREAEMVRKRWNLEEDSIPLLRAFIPDVKLDPRHWKWVGKAVCTQSRKRKRMESKSVEGVERYKDGFRDRYGRRGGGLREVWAVEEESQLDDEGAGGKVEDDFEYIATSVSSTRIYIYTLPTTFQENPRTVSDSGTRLVECKRRIVFRLLGKMEARILVFTKAIGSANNKKLWKREWVLWRCFLERDFSPAMRDLQVQAGLM